MSAAASTEPLYAAVKTLILSRIHSGEWPPHHRIPSEAEWVAELGVSRMTANRALRELASDGVLRRVQGVGSFVAEKKAHSDPFEVRNIAEEIRERGHTYAANILLLQQEIAPPDIADQLDLALGAVVYHSMIVHLENDAPVQIEDRYVRPDAAPDYLNQDYHSVAPNAYLMRAAPLARAEHSVEAVLPKPWEAKLLAISRAEPCLLIQRRTWSVQGPVSSVRLVCPGSRYRLESQFSPRTAG